VLYASRFDLPDHFEAASDLCAGKIYLGRTLSQDSRGKVGDKLLMEDGEERTEGISYSAIAYEKLCQKP
jgi:hypothetical protein